MDKDAYLEINASQRPALALFEAMGYTYISPADCDKQRGSRYHVLLRDILRGQLRRLNRYAYAGAENEFSAANIERAMEDLDEPLTDGLVRTSEKIYDALLLGKSYPETVGEGKMLSFNLRYIDWDNPQNNVFHVTEEFAVDSQDRQHNARPDIVLFINGIPFAVIECKAPHIPVEEAVGQMIRNQQAAYIPQLFKFAQLVMATNKNAVKYATAGTPKKFWSVWKEQDTGWLQAKLDALIPDRMPTEQDRNIVSLFSRERVFELIRYFILFDANVKKVCRYQQFFAVREIMKTIAENDEHGNRQSGVIWHTQGSGKSLTMVMLAKYILMELKDCHPRVVIVTDRKELDAQIAATFSSRLRRSYSWWVGSLISTAIFGAKAASVIRKSTLRNSSLRKGVLSTRSINAARLICGNTWYPRGTISFSALKNCCSLAVIRLLRHSYRNSGALGCGQGASA
jgi:type I restriction enzyme R subunit